MILATILNIIKSKLEYLFITNLTKYFHSLAHWHHLAVGEKTKRSAAKRLEWPLFPLCRLLYGGGVVVCRAAGQLQDVVGGSRFAGGSFRRGAGEPRVQEARALSSRSRVKRISDAAIIAKK